MRAREAGRTLDDMSGQHHVLFIQGGGKGAHDEWDNQLVASLEKELGQAYEVEYPRMPHEEEPSYARWKTALEKQLGSLKSNALLVAHSVGGTILLKTLCEHRHLQSIAALVLISAPFVGPGGWSSDELEIPSDLGARLPKGAPIHFYQGLADETAPPAHVELYARAVPQAQIHRLKGRDHQLNNDLSEVARVIRSISE